MRYDQYYDKTLTVITTEEPLPNGHNFAIRVEYTSKETAGVAALVGTSAFSLIAVIGLLIVIARNAWINRHAPAGASPFIRSQFAAYFISLLLCDMLQAVGSIMSVKWVIERAVFFGSYCRIQGAIKQISDVGTATWTLILAIHTFNVVLLQAKVPRALVYATIFGGWAIIATIVTIGPAGFDKSRNGPFWAISGMWCWISPEYPALRIVLDYLEMFMSAGFCFILYILVFLRIRGNIAREGWNWQFSKARRFVGTRTDLFARAKRIVWYPVAYTALLLPIAIARFVDWSGHEVPFKATIFADVIFLLSGVVNVGLFYMTRMPSLHPRGAPTVVSMPTVDYTTIDLRSPESALRKPWSPMWSSDGNAIPLENKTHTLRFSDMPA